MKIKDMFRDPYSVRSLMPGMVVLFLLLGFGFWNCAHTPPQSQIPATNAVETSQPLSFTVLFFNDIHGYLDPFMIKQDDKKIETGGIARMATLIENIRTENATDQIQTFVLFAGDALQGTPMSTEFKGKVDFLCFNRIGLNAMTVGNHEFDFGKDNLMELKSLAEFPILSCNIFHRDDGSYMFEPYTTIPLSPETDLTVIGVTTSQLLTTTKPSNVKDIVVTDPVDSVFKEYNQVKGRGPVILLSHSEARTDEAVANRIPELTAIIGGHDQILLNPRKLVGKVPVFQAFEKGRYLGRIDVLFDTQTLSSTITNWTYYPVSADIADQPDVADIVEQYRSELDVKFSEEIGHSEVYMTGDRDKIRYEETNLGDFVTDIMREYTGAEIAVLNSGSLRASLDEGPITMEEVFQVMPYANELMSLDITGDVVAAMLKRSVQGSREDEDGGFLHVSGLSFAIRNKSPIDIKVNGEPIDPSRSYSVAITDFMAEGGDGYDMLKNRPVNNTRLPLRELIIDTIRSRKTVTAAVEGRIVRID